MGGTLRRNVGALAGTALAVLLTCAATDAALLGTPSSRPDLAAALMLRLFGETTDASASFFAQNGDRISESPLHELALRVTPPVQNGIAAIAYVPRTAMPAARLSLASLGTDDAAVLSRAESAGLFPASGGFTATQPQSVDQVTAPELTEYSAPTYRPLPPVPNISPAPGTVAFDAPVSDGTQSSALLTLQPTKPLTLTGAAPDLSVPAFSASANAPSGLTLPERVPQGAGLTLPVLHGVTLKVNDDPQNPTASDAMLGVPNLGPIPNLYAGRLTYAIPKLSSTLSISAYQERLEQNALPANAYTNNGGDVNFTVKF